MKSLLILVVAACCAQAAHAQCDSLRQVQMEIDTFYAMVDDSTVDRNEFYLSNELTPYYSFDYQEDSCRVRLRIGEFALNNNWIHLVWCDDKVYNYDVQGDTARWDYTNAELSAISRTRSFNVKGGDTVSFFREVFWYDSLTSSYNPSRLVSTDDLYFSVELVKTSDGSRVALLDSISLRTSGASTPCLYLWRPVLARVGYLVPMSVDSLDAYVRVNVASSGGSSSRFMRFDNMRLALSKTHLTDAGWNLYATNVTNANNCTQSCTFSVSALSDPRRIQVSITPSQTAVDLIKIVDLNGDVVNTTAIPTGSPYSVSIANAGLYIVPGYKTGSVVCTKLMYVP